MSTISLRLSDEESKLIQSYVNVNGLNLSSFIRETVLDRIEDDYGMDEQRILAALSQAEKEPRHELADAWEALGV